MRLVRVTRALVAAAALLAVSVPAASAAVARPRPVAPAAGASSPFVPAFSWTAVAAADHYEFQLASDQTFSSIVVGTPTPLATRNTNATPPEGLPTGRYWWRVRAVTATGTASGYTDAREVRIAWTQPQPLTPADGATVPHPAPIVLDWAPTQGAARYRVYLAADDALASQVDGFPVDTRADELAVPKHLPTNGQGAPKSYWWSIAPIDSRGHVGPRSDVRRLVRAWDTATTTTVTDLSPEDELYTPALSWTPVAGAVSYEIAISADPDFSAGSIVCCTSPSVATRYVPTDLLWNNAYYWKVAPVDSAGNLGAYTDGPIFEKTFDLVTPSVPALRMRDSYGDPGTDEDAGTAGYQTSNPLVVWDRVPGAAGYYVDIAPWNVGSSLCDWTDGNSLRLRTATNAFSPLGPSISALEPLPPNGVPVAKGLPDIQVGGRYCVRVRAWQGTTRDGQQIYSAFTHVQGAGGVGWSFEYIAPTSTEARCATSYVCADDLVAPASGATHGFTPYFVWKPVTGAQAYWVIVAADPDFTSIVDYALTNVPSYAPRDGGFSEDQVKTYADEDTSYYWTAIPADLQNGGQAQGEVSLPNTSSFRKASVPPALTTPVATVSGAPTFSWSPVDGARSYTLQVKKPDGTTETIITHAPSYTSFVNYGNDSDLTWRVRANDSADRGLTWSQWGSIDVQLPVPTVTAGTPAGGEGIPTWRWSGLQGAIRYDFQGTPPGQEDASEWTTAVAATTPVLYTGTGIAKWRVRAVYYGANQYDTRPGAWTPYRSYTKGMGAPTGLAVTRPGGGILVSWQPKAGAYRYKVELAKSPAGAPFDQTIIDGAAWAPNMVAQDYKDGGTLYARVALYDEDGNTGAWSQTVATRLPLALRVTVSGYAQVGQPKVLQVTVTDVRGRKVRGAKVTVVGAGVKARAATTSKLGVAKLKVIAKRDGRFVIRAVKRGFAPATAEQVAI